jgi:hypothetical protein
VAGERTLDKTEFLSLQKINSMSILVAQFKNMRDADFIAQLIRMIQGKKEKVNVMSDDEWEDYVLGKLADEAETQGGTVSREEIAKHFKKHGINL